MPFVASCLFFIPLLLFLWLLDKLPPPSVEDEMLRTKRQPMTGAERLAFVKKFAPGLVLLILSYALLTAFRDFRDNFSAEIWQSLKYRDPSVFTQTETPISIIVLIAIASLMVIKNNGAALMINHLMVLVGMLIVGGSTFAFQHELISPLVWMTLVGMGLYFGYIQFNSIFFD